MIPCKSKDELRAWEFHLDANAAVCVNKLRAYGTKYMKGKDRLAYYVKYQAIHKQEIAEKKTKYYQEHKDQILERRQQKRRCDWRPTHVIGQGKTPEEAHVAIRSDVIRQLNDKFSEETGLRPHSDPKCKQS
jgi:hypothetical protein